MKHIFKKLRRIFSKKDATVPSSDIGKCTKCKFNKDYFCSVGEYYAEKGLSKVCFEGELWQSIDQ